MKFAHNSSIADKLAFYVALFIMLCSVIYSEDSLAEIIKLLVRFTMHNMRT